MQKMSVSMQKKQQLIEWRRSKVLEYHSQGYSMTEITNMLHVKNVSTISRDLEYLREKAQENLKTHIQQKLPEEFQRCLTGMNQVLKLCWQIANNTKPSGLDLDDNKSNTVTTGDDRTRLQALALINDCYKYIMDLTTNGVVITDAIKFVQTNKEKLTTAMSNKEENDKEMGETDHREDEVNDQAYGKQEEGTRELGEEKTTTNRVF
jgi:hypothetical protein